MKPISLAIILLLIFSCSEKPDCLKFRNGKYYMYSPITNHKIIIERRDSIQIENNNETGETAINKIEWLNDCEYKIIAISSNKLKKDGFDSFIAAKPINVQIISTGVDFYVFQIQLDSANKHLKYTDTLRVLKD